MICLDLTASFIPFEVNRKGETKLFSYETDHHSRSGSGTSDAQNIEPCTHVCSAMPPAKKKVIDPSQTEAAKAERAKAEEAKAKIKTAFMKFDLNQDGVVSEQELIRILMWPTEDGTQMDKKAATAIVNSFEQFDKNGDGVLSIDEFATALAAVGFAAGDKK